MDKGRRKFPFHFGRIIYLMFICITVKAEFDFKITPNGDIFLFGGADLLLNCSIHNSSYNVDLIDMGLNCSTLSDGNVTDCLNVQDQSIERFEGTDQLTFTLLKTNVSQADQGIYTCMYGDPPKFTSLKVVHIGDIPAKPENLSCISNNYRDLVCTASLNMKTTDIPMKWRMDYRVDGEEDTVDCKVIASTITCPPLKPLYKEQSYSITVNGSNLDYPVSVTKTFNIHIDYSIVKPGAVANLQFQLQNDSSEVLVTWNVPRGLTAFDMVLDYRIELVSLQNWTEPKTMNYSSTLILGNTAETYKLTDLIPNANYSVTIMCIPDSALSDLYWSEPKWVTFETNIDIPGKSVELTTGSYSYMQTNDSDVNIALYWKNPSSKESHGDINRYKVEIIEYKDTQYEVSTDALIHVTVKSLNTKRRISNEGRSSDQEEINGVLETFVLEYPFNISSSEYMIKVWAGNDAGFATTPGEIQIPLLKDVEIIIPSLVYIEKDSQNGKTLVSLEVDDLMGENVSMVTVYSCVADQQGDFKNCKKDLNWQRMKLTEQKIWINEDGQVKFAVSLETENGLSGGLVWQSYQFIYNEIPEQPIYSVKADQNNHTVLYVSVNQAQESPGGKPERYEVVWQKQDDEKEPLECPINVEKGLYTVDLNQGELTVPGLKAGVLYVVCVRSRNTRGSGSFGNPVQSRTSADIRRTTPQADNGVRIALGAGGGALLFFGVLCGIIWCIILKVKSVKDNLKISDFPEVVVLEDVNSSNKEKKIETKPPYTDSGTQSGTPSSSITPIHEDTGFSQDRRWSLVSNDSYSHVKAKKRNSSSGLSGYLRVDGDNSGLTMKDENDSLISTNDDEDDDNDAGRGKVNDHFNGMERIPNVYHEIDDTQDVFNDLTPVKKDITENNAYVDEVGNEPKGIHTLNSNSYTDSTPLNKPNMLREDYSQDYLCETSAPSRVQINEGIDENRYVPNDNPQSPEITRQKSRTEDDVEDMKSKCNVSSLLPCDSSSKGLSINTQTSNAEVGGMYTFHPEPGKVELPQNVSDVDEDGSDVDKDVSDDKHDDIIKTHNNAGKSAEFNSFENGADSIEGAGEYNNNICNTIEGDKYVVEDEYNSYSEFDDDSIMDESRDLYCNPDCISVGESSVCSAGSSIQNDNQNAIENNKVELGVDENDTNVAHDSVGVNNAISLSDTTSLNQAVQKGEKPNGYKTFEDSKVLRCPPEKPISNGVISKFILEKSADSNMKEKPLSESGHSYDSYVCAKLSQS